MGRARVCQIMAATPVAVQIKGPLAGLAKPQYIFQGWRGSWGPSRRRISRSMSGHSSVGLMVNDATIVQGKFAAPVEHSPH